QMDRSGTDGPTRWGQTASKESARKRALDDRASAGPHQAPPERTEERQKRRRGRGGQDTDKSSQAGNEAEACA
ncbi:MAG: hypothetical protein ACREQ3_10990, partial [Candidatus Binatia bacterium]